MAGERYDHVRREPPCTRIGESAEGGPLVRTTCPCWRPAIGGAPSEACMDAPTVRVSGATGAPMWSAAALEERRTEANIVRSLRRLLR